MYGASHSTNVDILFDTFVIFLILCYKQEVEIQQMLLELLKLFFAIKSGLKFVNIFYSYRYIVSFSDMKQYVKRDLPRQNSNNQIGP